MPFPSNIPIPILLLKSPSSPSHPSRPSSPSSPTSTPTSTPTSPPDPYTIAFPPPRYQTIHIPPLITTPLLTPLLTFLSSPDHPISTISAVVFTSQRAVRSFSLLLLSSSSSSPSSSSTFTNPSSPSPQISATTPLLPAAQVSLLRSLRIPIFAVGRATAAAIQSTLIGGAQGWMRGCWVEGSEAGTGEALAHVILRSLRSRRHHSHQTGEQWRVTDQTPTRTGDGGGNENGNENGDGDADKDRDANGDANGDASGDANGDRNGDRNETGNQNTKVLFLTGETRRDVLPRLLREGGVAVEEVVVYGTRVDDGFAAEVRRGLRETEEMARTSGMRWMVVFSGQGAREMLRGLGWLDENGRAKKEEKGEDEEDEEDDDDQRNWRDQRRRTLVASIGPTTAEYLKTEFGFPVDVCAEKPTPDALRQGMERYMQELHAATQAWPR